MNIKLGLGLLCLLALTPYFVAHKSIKKERVNAAQQRKESYRIAVTLPVNHPALEEIQQGFIDTINKQTKATYDVFVGNGNRALMRSQAEEIVKGNYDLVFAITTACTMLIKEVTDQRGSQLPIVFGAADDPVGNGIVYSLASSRNNVTGVTDSKDFDEQFALYRLLLPTMKSMLLVYNPSPGLIKQREALQALCAQHGIALGLCEILAVSELLTKIESQVSRYDAVLVLKDNMVVSGIETVVQVCDRFKVPLIASDLNSVQKGAALAFGVHESDYGVEAGYQALSILFEGKKPADIPVLIMNKFKLAGNESAIARQQVPIDPLMLFVMKNSEVIP